ncbi:TatD family hydrolase [Rubrivirga marina]|uniref:Hydrolase TatD n=1 Tax=Rubrivirga marina TaxID=1196024 RepID=A0A271J233_9BACT|nr:TatD family hydrolase [Rubrivirga marina]PAP77318.1 hydrolase TatD [Rubrivirga marina]
MTPALVDTHVHLYADAYDADRDAVVARARAAGVAQMILPAVDLASVDDVLALCDRHVGVFGMAGLHPTYLGDAPEEAAERIGPLLQDRHIIAVGETGLDYYWSREHEERQRASLAAHARLAAAHRLPLSLHNRDKKDSDDASRDLVAILREVKAEAGDALTGVFHCFGGPTWLAHEVLDLGFFVGLGGTLTFKNAGVPDAIADVPLDRIVLETDGPYLAPTPHRGSRNEPAYVALVAQTLARVRGLTVGEVAEATTANARRLFGLPDS